jgi:hypothetical protein
MDVAGLDHSMPSNARSISAIASCRRRLDVWQVRLPRGRRLGLGPEPVRLQRIEGFDDGVFVRVATEGASRSRVSTLNLIVVDAIP